MWPNWNLYFADSQATVPRRHPEEHGLDGRVPEVVQSYYLPIISSRLLLRRYTSTVANSVSPIHAHQEKPAPTAISLRSSFNNIIRGYSIDVMIFCMIIIVVPDD